MKVRQPKTYYLDLEGRILERSALQEAEETKNDIGWY